MKQLNFDKQRNSSSPELKLSSIPKFQRAIDQRKLYDSAEAGNETASEMAEKDDSSKNPKILSNTPLRFIMESELEGPAAKWFSTESSSEMSPSNFVSLRVNSR